MRRNPEKPATLATIAFFVVLPLVAFVIALWPVLGTSYVGLPIAVARLVTIVGFTLGVVISDRPRVLGFQLLTRSKTQREGREFSPAIGRRAFVLSAIGVAIAGGGVALARKLYGAA